MAERTGPRERHRRHRAKQAKRIGKRIRKARDEAPLTQAELAVLVGVSQVSIHHWETGKVHSPEWAIPLLAKHLGKPEEWLRSEAA